MKTKVKVILITLMVALLSQCKKEPESVNIKDINFLNALLSQGIDKNGDGNISTDEAAQVHFLDVGYRNISDLRGIETFVNLDSLL
jgi:hypothetical protein